MPITETRENENFGKNRLSHGLTKNPVFRSKSSAKFGKKFGKSSEISEKVQ